MTVARSVSDVLDQHVDFEVECIDRMYLNVYQPRLQHPLGVVGFLRSHLGYQFASTALVDPISKAFVADIHRFAAQHEVALVDFARGQRKDDLARQYLAGFTPEEGVLFIGRAQEKNAVFRTEKRRNPHTGASYPWIVRSTGVINQFYFYCVDADFGPFFLKFSSYFPYTAKLCINGNEWAKRQATRAGIDHTALDNGFASCADPAALQAICDQLDAAKIDALLRKWLAILPHPFTAKDRAAGYRYDVSILPGRVLPDPHARPASLGAGVLRGGDPGEPRHRPAGLGRADLQPADPPPRKESDPESVPHPGTHRRSHPKSARGLQALQDQTVPQGRPRAAHRDHHQRHRRLQHRPPGCATCPPCGRSASPPTDVCSTSNVSPTTQPSATA